MDNRVIDIGGFDICDNNLYFNTMSVNGIFCMDIKKGKVRYMTTSGKYHFFDGYLYRDAKFDNGKIWFAPYSSNDILIYDVGLSICTYISIPQLAGHGRKQVKFCGLYDVGKQFIFVPAEYPAILKIDKESLKISVIEWEEKLLKEYPNFIETNKYMGISSWNYEVYNKKLYLFAGNISIKYNIETDELHFLQISNERKMYSGLARYVNTFALADRAKGELQIWREEDNKIVKSYDLGYRGESVGDDGGPIWVFHVNQGIVVAQGKDKYLRYLDNEGKDYKIELDIDKCGSDGNFYIGIKQKENNLIIPVNGQNKVLIVNTNNWSQRCVRMNLEEIDFSKLLAEAAKQDWYMVENTSIFQLSDLMKMMIEHNDNEISDKRIQSIGMKVYRI